MKPKFKAGYLFADGHAVIIYGKDDPQAGEIRWAEIVEHFGPECRFTGRIVFHWGADALFFRLVRKAVIIEASEPSLKNGSDRTKELGIAVGSLTVHFSNHHLDHVRFHELSCLGARYTYQPNNAEVFNPEASHWSDCKVSKIHRAKQAEQALPA